MATNRLAAETSPYLRQHADNPVDWWPWCDEALALARRENRLILLSVGYSACHWCHVMAHECFESPAIAALMNARYVCVKVDREERPDVDQVYQTAVQILRQGGGGWPLTVFLTPTLEPVWGATYLPPTPRHGLPSLPEVLRVLSDSWAAREDDLRGQAAALLAQVQAVSRPASAPGDPPDGDGLVALARRLLKRVDRAHGGFGSAPKFPNASGLLLLLRAYHRCDDRAFLEPVERALDAMAAGGIHDQLGGGFHRYSTDEHWLVPHFEKMLYDNAALLEAYGAIWQITGRARYGEVAEGIVDWLLREMEAPGGGFYTAQDADTEGHEGRFFAWSMAEFDDAVGATDAEVARELLGVTGPPSFEDGYVLHRPRELDAVAADHGISAEAAQTQLEAARRALFAAREARIRPGLDDKLLTAWNGQMLGALADASVIFDRPDWLGAAQRAARRFTDAAVLAGGVCRRQVLPSTVAPRGTLDDSAWLALGLVRLHAADGASEWLDRALEITDRMVADFHDAATGGWFVTATDGDLTVRLHSGWDGAMPAGASAAAELLERVGCLTGRADLRALARETVRSQLAALRESPLGFAHLLLAADLIAGPTTELVFGGTPAAVRALRDGARRVFAPHVIVAHLGATALDPALISGRTIPPEGARAWLCRDYACAAPTGDSSTLARQLISE